MGFNRSINIKIEQFLVKKNVAEILEQLSIMFRV